MKYNSVDYIGRKIGYLTIVGYDNGYFTCECKCGKIIRAKAWSVANEKKKSCSSCDCEYAKRLRRDAPKTHGLTGHRLYTIWHNIVARCHHPQNPNYENYGKRGIKICDEWRFDVNKFIVWSLSNGYDDTLSIDRIDVNGDYEPSNCRWVNMKIQLDNRRDYETTPRKATKHIWTIKGETKRGVEWCKIYGVSFPTVMYRVKKFNITPEEALTMSKIQSGRPREVSVNE